ncbi:odorant receptor 13a-like [Apis florea]|uniref:odorant receptor 13a-like n=1 Tax=Apis florea TaxID=7463 RepID=UPI0012FF5A9A|nr:odorant receptor 13a-like [Apis florea]
MRKSRSGDTRFNRRSRLRVSMQVEPDVSVNLAAFFLKNIGLWISDDPAYERRRKVILVYTIWCIMLSSVVIGRDVYFTWFYDGDILYVVTNALSMMMITVKICMIVIRKEEFINLIVYMQENFWNDNYYDFREKEIFENCKRTCAFFVSLVTTIGICAILSYLATPLIVQTVSNNSERMLPFNMWLKLPLSESPYYEIMFVYQIMTFYFIGISYFCFDNIFCIMTVHLAGQFQILRYRFAKLCNVEDQISEKDTGSTLFVQAQRFYERFKAYVRYHQTLIDYCEKIENVYTMIILGQVLVFSVLICLFGYQILLANAPSARRAIFIFLLIGAMSLLFMFTFSCNGVIEHSDNVAVGAYAMMWTIMPMNKFGRMLRKDLIMVMERSRRVCCLTANGFFPVSLETYTTILSTAVSYFTLLRNNVEKANEAYL